MAIVDPEENKQKIHKDEKNVIQVCLYNQVLADVRSIDASIKCPYCIF